MAAIVSGHPLVGYANHIHSRIILSFKQPFSSICLRLLAPLVIFYPLLMDYRTIETLQIEPSPYRGELKNVRALTCISVQQYSGLTTSIQWVRGSTKSI